MFFFAKEISETKKKKKKIKKAREMNTIRHSNDFKNEFKFI